MESLKIIEIRPHTWGKTAIFYHDPFTEGRFLLLNPDKATSFHAHASRSELQIPLCGIVARVDERATRIDLPGEKCAWLIPPHSFHQFTSAPGEPGVVLSLTFGRVDGDRA